MSSELERRLEGVFAEAPEPDPGAGEEALHRALRALHPVAAPRRGLRAAVLAFAAAIVLLVIAAGSLAAVGALHVSFGAKPKQVPVTSGLLLPKDADGIAAIVYGRLSATTTSGFDLQGLPVTAATLSPHGLYVAAGIGRAIVALAPSGRRAWSQPLGAGCPRSDHVCGTVASIAWAPDGLRVAYVVRTATRKSVLHVIWGNGTHDTVVDRNAQGVTPSWRADSLAVAYVGSGGRPVVYDLGHESHRVIHWDPARQIEHLAFAPAWHSACTQYRELSPAGRKAPRGPLARPDSRRRLAGQSACRLWASKPAVGRAGPALHGGASWRDAAAEDSAPRADRRHPRTNARPREPREAARRLARVASPGAAVPAEALSRWLRDPDRQPRRRSGLARPERDRDVARLRRDLRRPEPPQRPGLELHDLAGEEGRGHDLTAERGEVERAIRHRDGARAAVRPPQQGLEGRAVAARDERPRAREGDLLRSAAGPHDLHDLARSRRCRRVT